MAKNLFSKQQPSHFRYSDVSDEPTTRLLLPIRGYEAVSLVSLEEAVASVSKFFNGIEEYVYVAKENCKYPADGLNQDESASIHVYTMEFGIEPSLYKVINAALRAENREALKPWFSFLKLFLTALYKLPLCAQTVWRGVRDVDLSSKYPNGRKFVWWGVSSCTHNVDVLKSDSFLGNQGIRTLFCIECKNGRPIGSHSYFKNHEGEIILMPGSFFEVVGQLNPTPELYMIHLKQIDPPIEFIKPPFTNLLAASNPMQKFSIPTPMSSKLQVNQQSSAPLPSSRRQLGIIILGNTGVGKSFLANILLGHEAFVHKAAPRAVTTETEFEEMKMGNETYSIFNIPGLIEADQKRIEMNKIEIDKAFRARPTSLILYVFGAQGGRIRDEDVVAFNVLNKAYPFKLESLVMVVNGVPKDRPKNYEGEVTVFLEDIIEVPCKTLCVLDAINKSNPDERQKLKNKLLEVIIERTPKFHKKEQEIELQREEVRKAKEKIRALQEEFHRNKQMYDEEIKKQQAMYDKMFAQIRNENEQMRHLIRRQAEEIREFNNRMVAQEAAHKKREEKHDAKHRKDIGELEKKLVKAIDDAQEASKLI
jgi:hypothetical protein